MRPQSEVIRACFFLFRHLRSFTTCSSMASRTSSASPGPTGPAPLPAPPEPEVNRAISPQSEGGSCNFSTIRGDWGHFSHVPAHSISRFRSPMLSPSDLPTPLG